MTFLDVNCLASMSGKQRKLKMRMLETERLVLREFRQDDLEDVVSWESAPNVGSCVAKAQEFLDFCFREYFRWGIGPWGMLVKQTRVMVGNCGFWRINFSDNSGDVNYFVAPQYRGNGFAPEGLRALVRFGFRDIGLARIQAQCTLDNMSSERVMQKVGMRFEQILRTDQSPKEDARNEKLYAILRRDYHLPSE